MESGTVLPLPEIRTRQCRFPTIDRGARNGTARIDAMPNAIDTHKYTEYRKCDRYQTTTQNIRKYRLHKHQIQQLR